MKRLAWSGQTAFLITMIVLATVLRMPITGVGSLVSTIREDLGASNTVMGMLTSVPMLVFAVVSPLAAAAGRKWGMGRTILLALVLILAGQLVRSYTGPAGLFGGTAVLAAGIGVINVLGVALIKLRAAPERVGAVTSLYSTTMAATAAVSIALSVPIAVRFGWRHALAAWSWLAVLAIVVWGVQHRRAENQVPAVAEGRSGMFRRLLRRPLAWQMTVFMGAQTMFFYCVTGWFPTILQSRGFTVDEAGVAASMLQLMTLPFTFLVPFLCGRVRPFVLTAAANAAVAAGLLLFIFCPARGLHYVALAVMAVGMGAIFSLCNLFFSLRTRNAAETTALSGMAQCIGYILASVGPVTMGRLFDLTSSWYPPLIFLFAILVVNIVSSQLSARESYLFE